MVDNGAVMQTKVLRDIFSNFTKKTIHSNKKTAKYVTKTKTWDLRLNLNSEKLVNCHKNSTISNIKDTSETIGTTIVVF